MLIFKNLNKHSKFTKLFIQKKKFEKIETKDRTSQTKQIERNQEKHRIKQRIE